jgi:hypothetical protein
MSLAINGLDITGIYNGEKEYFWNYWEFLEEKFKEKRVYIYMFLMTNQSLWNLQH